MTGQELELRSPEFALRMNVVKKIKYWVDNLNLLVVWLGKSFYMS